MEPSCACVTHAQDCLLEHVESPADYLDLKNAFADSCSLLSVLGPMLHVVKNPAVNVRLIVDVDQT